MSNDKIIGINPVLEALKAGRPVQRLLISDQRKQDRDIQAILRLARAAAPRSGSRDAAHLIGLATLASTACREAEPPRQYSQSALDVALADPARETTRLAADERRKPGPLIALAGVKPGDKVPI